MPPHVGLGTSENQDAFLAGQEAARLASERTERGQLDLLIVFSSVSFNQLELLQGIKSICENATIIGCSSAGEITTQGSTKNSVALMGFNSNALGLSFATGAGFGLSQDARDAGRKCAQQTIKTTLSKRHLFLAFPDGLAGNGADVIKGIQEVLGTSFPIVGGSAGDDFLFQKTYQYYHDKVLSDSVVGILLGGEISVGIGVRHGWCAIGKAHQVTRARGNIISELDGKGAFKIYQDYFGEEAQNLKKLAWAKVGTIYPLGMSIPDEDEYLIRYAFRATSNDELVCAAQVPQGAQVHLMIADKKGVLQATQEATLRAKESLRSTNILAAIIFDSVARKRVLGLRAQEEVEVIKETLGKAVPIIGFYSYGELAPLRAERYIGKSYFHNETIVVLCIAQAK